MSASKKPILNKSELIEENGLYLSYPKAAKLIGVSAKTLQRETAAGRLPAYAILGRRTMRVKASDVLDLMEQVA